MTDSRYNACLIKMAERFDHPATVLWRTVEVAEVADFIADHPLESPVLDLGSGEGNIAESLFGKRVIDVGLDNEAHMAKAAAEAGVYQIVVLGDGCRLPFCGQSLGTVFSNSVVEHIPALGRLLVEVSRVLKPGGVFLFPVPNNYLGDYLFPSVVLTRLGMPKLAKRYSDYRNRRLAHHNLLDDESWRAQLENAGLEVVEMHHYLSRPIVMLWDAIALVVYPFSSLLKLVLPFRVQIWLLRATAQVRLSFLTVVSTRFLSTSEAYSQAETGAGTIIAARRFR